MKKKLTPEELSLWELNTRDVKLLEKNKIASKTPFSPTESKRKHTFKSPVYDLPATIPHTSLPCFDRRNLRNLLIEARLDMHGLTLEGAYKTLERFLRNAQERNITTILVITGKGDVTRENTLRYQLPRWLEQTALRHLVVSLHHPARLQDGGTGAFYVRVKRKDKRSPSKFIVSKRG